MEARINSTCDNFRSQSITKDHQYSSYIYPLLSGLDSNIRTALFYQFFYLLLTPMFLLLGCFVSTSVSAKEIR